MLQARDNPFAVHRVLQQRYRLSEEQWRALLAQWERQGRRGAVVGPHGSGKTTLLEDFARRLTADGWRPVWLRLDESCRMWVAAREQGRSSPELDSLLARGNTEDRGRQVVLIDGAEQLGVLSWWFLRLRLRGAGGMLVTTHTPGRLKTLWTCRTDAALLRELCAALGQPLDAERAADLHLRFRGNVRDALRHLYDCAGTGLAASQPGLGSSE